MTDPVTEPTEFIEARFSQYIIIGCSVVALVWGAVNALWVSARARF